VPYVRTCCSQTATLITLPHVGVQSIVISESAHLSVQSHILKNTCPNYTEFSVHVKKRWPWFSPNLETTQYLYTFRLVDDIMFLHHGDISQTTITIDHAVSNLVAASLSSHANW